MDMSNKDQEEIRDERNNISRKSRRKIIKICLICGDKASGYNFSVLTCESCKAFFRRNAIQEKTLQCPSQSNCAITMQSRKFCPRCRLKKCFDVGMRPDFMMTEEELVQKRRRLMHRKLATDGDWSAGLIRADGTSKERRIGRPVSAQSDCSDLSVTGSSSAETANRARQNDSTKLGDTKVEFDGDLVTIQLQRSTFFDIILGKGDATVQLSILRHAVLASMTPNSIIKEKPAHSPDSTQILAEPSTGTDIGIGSTDDEMTLRMGEERAVEVSEPSPSPPNNFLSNYTAIRHPNMANCAELPICSTSHNESGVCWDSYSAHRPTQVTLPVQRMASVVTRFQLTCNKQMEDHSNPDWSTQTIEDYANLFQVSQSNRIGDGMVPLGDPVWTHRRPTNQPFLFQFTARHPTNVSHIPAQSIFQI